MNFENNKNSLFECMSNSNFKGLGDSLNLN